MRQPGMTPIANQSQGAACQKIVFCQQVVFCTLLLVDWTRLTEPCIFTQPLTWKDLTAN